MYCSYTYAQESQTIAAVEVRGTRHTNPQVAQIVVTKAGVREGVPFSSDAFTEARQKIREIGLYVLVSGRTETTEEQQLRVIFEVTENPVVKQVVLVGNHALSFQELLPRLQTQTGQVLNTVTLDQDLLKIQQAYKDKGFHAFVTNAVGIDPKTGILTIPVQETVVEAITFPGLKKTRPYVATREMKTRVGEPLNANQLQKDLQRVQNIGLFSVEGWHIEDGDDLGRARVVVPVREEKSREFHFDAGYSPQQRLTGTVSLAENDFQGRGQSLNLAWTVGGLSTGSQFDIGFTEPWLDRHNTSMSVNVYNRVQSQFSQRITSGLTSGTNTDPYYEERRGGSFTLSRPLSDDTRILAKLRAETIRANNLQSDYDQLTPQEIADIRGSLVSRGNVTSLTLRSVTNTRDYEPDPASGFYVSPAFELGIGQYDYRDPHPNPGFIDDATTPNEPRALIASRSQTGSFHKANLDLRAYLPIDGKKRSLDDLRQPKSVFASRLLLGAASGNIGFSDQYFLGGVNTLRGYSDDRYWGNNMLLLSSELRVPLDRRSGSLTGVLFFDIGDAWGGSDLNRENLSGFEQHGRFSPHAGFGLGVRLKTPVGPVRLDYGIGETNRLHFSIGQSF